MLAKENIFISIIHRRIPIYLFLDPVGIKSPAFSSDLKGTIFTRHANSDIVLLCQSQGYPVPEYR